MKSFSISNKNLSLTIIEYGATIQSLKFNGKEMVLGFENFNGYLTDTNYLGAVVGRYANRISNGEFTLNGIKYSLTKNEPNKTLHGGEKGLSKVYWQGKVEDNKIIMEYLSLDGEEGFPGDLKIKVTYSLEGSGLVIYYSAISNKDTVVNLTNHAFFNLNFGKESILNHEMYINANAFTPINEQALATGEIRKVENTVFDFTTKKVIGDYINSEDEQIKLAGGFDHNFCINGTGFRKFAEVDCKESNIRLECFSTMPGMQFYSGNFLSKIKLKENLTIDYRYGLCLETQYYPDSVNKENFVKGFIKAGEEYSEKTEFRFSNIK